MHVLPLPKLWQSPLNHYMPNMALMTQIFSPALLALILTAVVLFGLLHSGAAASIALDEPNHRSLHSMPTPRVGGVAMFCGIAAAWLFSPGADYLLIGLFFALTMLSLADDCNSLPIRLRLVVHFLVAVIFILFHSTITATWLVVTFAIVIVWLINLYNFMDGADGLAGGMAFFGFGSYGVVAFLGGDWLLATKCLSVSAAALGFLLFNFPPAKVFMGDSGAIPMGFLAGVLGLEGWNHGLWHFWFPILVFSPFVVDATVTLLKRIVQRQRFWLAHHDHYYQRIIRMGATHRMAAIAEYVLMSLAAASAIYGNGQPATGQSIIIQYSVLCVWALLYVGLMLVIDLSWRSFTAAKARADK